MSESDRTDKRAFAAWLEQALRAKGWGVREAARNTGLSGATMSDLLAGNFLPRWETIVKLARALDLRPEEVEAQIPSRALNRAAVPSRSTLIVDARGVVLVPILDQLAGAGRGAMVVDYAYVSPSVAAGRNLVAVRVRGDCMLPDIRSGDVVIVDQDRAYEIGNVVLAKHDDTLIIKRAVGPANGKVRLQADNPDFIPREVVIPEEEIVGVAIEVSKSLV